MIRLLATIGVIGLPMFGQADDVSDAATPCAVHQSGRVQLVLSADEFAIPAYDAHRGLVLVQPQTDLLPTLDRPYAVRLRMARARVLMPLGPTGLFFGLTDGADDLQMLVEAESTAPDCAVARKPACDELSVRALHLKRGEMVISSRQLDQPVGPVVSFETRVMHRVQHDRGELDAPALGLRGLANGEACLRRGLTRTRAIQGALTVQLESSVVGEPAPPKVVVDGLVNPAVTECLVDALTDDAKVWAAVGPAARGYLTLYFRGEAVESPGTVTEAVLASP